MDSSDVVSSLVAAPLGFALQVLQGLVPETRPKGSFILGRVSTALKISTAESNERESYVARVRKPK